MCSVCKSYNVRELTVSKSINYFESLVIRMAQPFAFGSRLPLPVVVIFGLVTVERSHVLRIAFTFVYLHCRLPAGLLREHDKKYFIIISVLYIARIH